MVMCGRVFDVLGPEAPGAIAHGELGPIPVPPIQMTMGLSWAIKNTGDADGYTALKVWVIEKKAWPVSDVEWLVFTPLKREGGPKLDVDIVYGEAGTRTTYSAAPVLIPPGMTRVARTSLYLPGYNVTAKLKDFWTKHAGAPFKIVVEVLHVDVVGEWLASLGSHTFDEAFRLQKAVAAARLEATTSYLGVEQPELSIVIF